MPIIFQRVLFFLCLFLSTFSYASAESPEDFVAHQEIIRACIGNGPNFGDQAATINVMSRLRQLGFAGTFEVIYDAEESLNKVITLFGLPANLPPEYHDKDKKIKFIALKTHQDHLKQHTAALVDLGVSVGKSNRICDPTTAYTKTFVQFSPYFDSRGSWHAATNIEIKDQTKEVEQDDSGKKYFIFPVSTYEQAKQFLQYDGKSVLEKKPGLSTFLEGMEKQNFNVLPVYGRTLRFSHTGDTLIGSPSPSNILQTIAGARYAQLMGPSALQKPLVIAFFDNYEKYADELLQLIKSNHWGVYEQSGAEKAREIIQQLGLAKVLSTASLSDADSIHKLNSLKPGEILLLSVGSLPKVAFDGIYTYQASNIWPAVHEGAGTFSTLALTTKPRFECADTSWKELLSFTWTLGFELVKNPLLKADMQRFYQSQDGYCGSTLHDPMYPGNFMRAWETKVYQMMGEFIIAANDPHSTFSEYFVDLHKEVLKLENDRVHYALLDVMKIVK